MVEVRKKERETDESLIRRFTRTLQQSRVLNMARSTRFRQKKKTKRQLIKEAVYKERLKKEIDKLKKMDRFDESKLKDIKQKIADK
ncbi:MAG: hypothetical protein PHQ20_01155 [Candidatus Moranbacteria bacterium]|jgi:ribosomal protein S21|nr:hypothetical protein [Candidatus Moranbacteria bacterium]